MSCGSLLVHLAHDAANAERTQAAIRLARALDMHLIGLAATDLIDLPAAPRAAASLAECAARVWDALRDQAEHAAAAFGHACREAGLASYEAVVDESEKGAALIRHARCSDLTLLSQADPGAPTFAADRTLLEQAILYSARPTLLLPYAGRHEAIGRDVLVAWDDSREAARAAADALPLLRRADRVRVVSWNEGGAAGAPALRAGLEPVGRWLACHGIEADLHVEPTAPGIADAMLSHACDVGADLIVMGAYGHTRWSERVLGGATRGLLGSMTVPVLMSH